MTKRVCFSLLPIFALTAFALLTPTRVDEPNCLPMESVRSRNLATLSAPIADAARAGMMRPYSKLPLSFEPNQGQAGDAVKFVSRGRGYELFLTGDEAVLALRNEARGESRERPKASTSLQSTKPDVLRMRLVGANKSPQIDGSDELPGRSNYFVGKDPQKWRTNIPNYAKVRYHNVYPGIDLVYYGHHGQLEYDFVVAPGANPEAIALDISGARSAKSASLAENGDLVIRTKGGEVRFRKPAVYQTDGSELQSSNRKSVPGRFVLLAESRIGFEVSTYDATKPLYIDPVISYATYLGGTSNDYAYGVAVDAGGNVYLVGTTYSTDFPAKAGTFDGSLDLTNVFVTKLSADGSTAIYSTFLGGSGRDEGNSIAVDAAGNAYVTGTTDSSDFPTTNAFQDHNGLVPCVISGAMNPCYDAFVSKLNPAGSTLLYSTYLGGSGFDSAGAIALDPAGNAYVEGGTTSGDFPTLNPIQQDFRKDCKIVDYGDTCTDAFVAKINPSASGAASLIYSTYLGGNGSDWPSAIAVDGNGNAYLTGSTWSTDFPTTAGAFQSSSTGYGAFVAKINNTGTALAYSALIGGAWGSSIAVDASGSAYVTGVTWAGFPTTPGAFDRTCGTDDQCNGGGDGFVTKLSPDGSQLVYSTYLGGSGWEEPYGIAVDSLGISYITGYTSSLDFPVTNSVYSSCHFSGEYCDDAFLAKLSAGGEGLIFSTYLGGDGHDVGYGVALDSSRNAYIAGTTWSTDFPATVGAYQQAPRGEASGFAVKFAGLALPAIVQSARSLNFGNQEVGITSPKQTVTIRNVGDAARVALSFNITGDFQLTQTCETALAAGTGCTMDVTFTPQAAGTRTGEVRIYNEATGQWETFLLLSGGGGLSPLNVSTSMLTFANQLVETTSEAQTVTLTNKGAAPVNFSSIQAATNFTHTTNCGSSLPAGASCGIDVKFAPKAAGSMTEQVTINHDAQGSPQTIVLNGKGTDFSVQPVSGTATVTAGEKATYSLNVNPTGFSGGVTMGCTWPDGQPAETSCSVSPAAVGLDGTHAANVTVSVSTVAPSAGALLRPPLPLGPKSYPIFYGAIWLLALASLASLAFRRRRAVLVLTSMLLLIVFWTACGGGSSSTTPTPVGGTPAGTYSLSVTGTASGVTRATTLSLHVK